MLYKTKTKNCSNFEVLFKFYADLMQTSINSIQNLCKLYFVHLMHYEKKQDTTYEEGCKFMLCLLFAAAKAEICRIYAESIQNNNKYRFNAPGTSLIIVSLVALWAAGRVM